MVFTIVWPDIFSFTCGSDMTASFSWASSRPAGSVRRTLTLPFTCTTHVTLSWTSRAGSAAGHAAFATLTADGGGLAAAALRPIEGAEQIARYLAYLAARTPSNVRFLERTVNGQTGMIAQLDGVTGAVYAFDIADGWITHIWVVRNPEKLRPWTTA